jgi:sigma-B regulation protein RsbU (phosphoserine phosphatase)
MSGDPHSAPSRPFTHDTVVLLVDDQPIIGEAVRRMLASEDGLQFHFCQDAREALQRAAELQPTVILQDLVMPHLDGLDLVPLYRRQDATRDTPLIVLSTKEEATTKAEAFARGANDYLVKLPDPVELVARIRYHSKGYIALVERNEAFAALADRERTLREELARAAEYVCSLLPDKADEPLRTDWRFIPSAALGGDAFDYQWIDDDHFAVCLLDVCGHGVGSALLSVSVINALRARALPDTDFTDPAQVLAGVNRAFPMERQNFLFFTMWYGVYDRSQQVLHYAGGGHPPALLLSPEASGQTRLTRLESTGPMVGTDDDAEFPAQSQAVRAGDRLFVYSDGVFEVRQADSGDMWSLEQFIEFMSRPSPDGVDKMDALLGHGRQLQGGDEFLDDFSIVQVVW